MGISLPAALTSWLSYDGSLDMGLHVDPAAVSEPELLRRCLEEAIGDLVAVGRT